MATISLPSLDRAREAKYRLVAARCGKCNAVHFPPRPLCGCGSTEMERLPLPLTGKVYSFTVVAEASTASEHAEEVKATGPFPIALVELENGTKAMGQITDCDPKEVRVGMEVEAVFRRMYRDKGVTLYGYKFRPR